MSWVNKCIMVICSLLLLVLIYFSIDPATSIFVPKCLFHYLTGLDCPACGVQRATHSLLHGDIVTALRYNYFLAISVPYLVAVVVTTFGNGRRVQAARRYVQHPIVVMIFLALTIVWWLVRNIPYFQEHLLMLS